MTAQHADKKGLACATNMVFPVEESLPVDGDDAACETLAQHSVWSSTGCQPRWVRPGEDNGPMRDDASVKHCNIMLHIKWRRHLLSSCLPLRVSEVGRKRHRLADRVEGSYDIRA